VNTPIGQRGEFSSSAPSMLESMHACMRSGEPRNALGRHVRQLDAHMFAFKHACMHMGQARNSPGNSCREHRQRIDKPRHRAILGAFNEFARFAHARRATADIVER
jgi:hypothetical protein